MKELPILTYKGYRGILRYNTSDRIRIYGKICPPEDPDTPLKNWEFAADNLEEACERFNSMVEKIIEFRQFKEETEQWKRVTDFESVRCVLDILPERFSDRLKNGQFDKNLLHEVKGGCYAVPLFYVTKAWDVLLKGKMEPLDYKIGPEEEMENCTEEDIAEFLKDNEASRSRGEAIRDNDRIKKLWKDYFDIDIDKLSVDFCKFNKHLPPRVSMQKYKEYFWDPINGINHWMLDRINTPECIRLTHIDVSSLMELTSQVVRWRKGKLIFYYNL